VVKWVKGEFSNTGTGGNISRGGHLFSSIWSHDTRLTHFVTGGGARLYLEMIKNTLRTHTVLTFIMNLVILLPLFNFI